MEAIYERIKGWQTKRLIRLRNMIRLVERPDNLDRELLKAVNRELRARTKRRYGKAV